MARKVIILDTSILCVWLRIPNMESIEKSGEKPITYDDVSKSIEKETADSSRIVLPLASIIECGNHITQINRKNHCRAADSQWEMSLLNRLPITIIQKATLPKSSPETPDSKHINPHHTPKFYHATATVAKLQTHTGNLLSHVKLPWT